jgi:hypothetical protein
MTIKLDLRYNLNDLQSQFQRTNIVNPGFSNPNGELVGENIPLATFVGSPFLSNNSLYFS